MVSSGSPKPIFQVFTTTSDLSIREPITSVVEVVEADTVCEDDSKVAAGYIAAAVLAGFFGASFIGLSVFFALQQTASTAGRAEKGDVVEVELADA